MKKFTLILLIFISSFTYANSYQLDFKDIVSIPDVSNAKLSPDGKHIAYLVKVDTAKNKGVLVMLHDIKNNSQTQLAYSENAKYIVYSILWGSNDVLLMKAKFPLKTKGFDTTETILLRTNIKTRHVQRVFPKNIFDKMKWVPNVLTDVIDTLPEDEDYILMAIDGFSKGTGEAVIKMPITDGSKFKTIQRAKSHVIDWITDVNHDVRIGIFREETTFNVTYKILERLGKGDFRTLWQYEALSKEKVIPLAFGADNKTLYVEALHQDKDAIYKVDLSDPSLEKVLVHSDEKYDVINNIRRSPKTGEVIGVDNYYWDDNYKEFIESINKSLPETNNYILDFSNDGETYILLATSDNEPGIYFLGNRKTKSLEVFAYKYEKLAPEFLANKQKVSYKARDGLKIEGFLTLPNGDKKENLPTIIFPHGRPMSRTSERFDYWTQFFANKGYAVLQMNFRGSSGYGFDFMQQGIAAWGQAMQDDIEDGTKWLIEQGITNKDKVCIVGAKHGGYAALMGAIKTPELYQCVVSFSGISDLNAYVESKRHFRGYELIKKTIGDDNHKLWQASPLKYADKIKVPVLLLHGTKDLVVKVSQSEKMFEKLKENNKSVNYVEIEQADHYLSNNEHRIKAFTAMDKFLEKYLPVN